MRTTILALATAGALAGTALPALAWDRDDNYGYYRHRYNHSEYYRPYYRYRRYDDNDYRPYRYRHWWWWRHHHHDYYDRPYRRYY